MSSMNALAAFLPSKRGPAPPDALSDLRFSLETMPGSRRYVFTTAARAEILSKLYTAFMGPHTSHFLPQGTSAVPGHMLLSEFQTNASFAGAGSEDPLVPGRACSHIFKKGESCYRCKDCALDDSCVLCSRCFHATDHTDHNVTFFIAQQSGGCCDCGDDEAWRRDIRCPHHPPAGPDDPRDTTPRVVLAPLSNTVPPAPNYPFRVHVPADLRDSMRRAIGFALDFLLDTLDYSPDEPSLPATEADLHLQPSADPMKKDQYCIVIWNDDKHSYDELTKLITDMTGRPAEEAAQLVRRIDENGREIIDMNSNVTRLLETAQSITNIDLGVTIRRAYDTFCEQVAAVIIEWLLDLTRSRVGNDTLVIRECLAAELLLPRKRDSLSKNLVPPTAISLDNEIPNPTRIDTLLLYHTRLWKRPRLSLKEVYASVISVSRAHKLAIAGHFANIYHRVIDAYLLVDREAETSIKYFALQLFTVPSVSGHIARNHRLVERLLAIITSFFTNRIMDKRIVYPPGIGGSTPLPLEFFINMGSIDVESFPFKSKRFMPVFSDLRYLASTSQVQQLIANLPSSNLLGSFAATCASFMCLNPNKRAVQSHVEYETDAWISVFNVTLSLSRVIKVFGEAFGREGVGISQLFQALSLVLAEIVSVCSLREDRRHPARPNALDKSKFPTPSFHTCTFGLQNKKYSVLTFDVSEGWVSFHHSLHWLLAELLKHVHLLTENELRVIGLPNLREVFVRAMGLHSLSGRDGEIDKKFLAMLDYPLRVLAMIAQIRTGLWVRNGFAIRGQLLHYRDYMLRELCYDQDLFLLQTGLVILPPDLLIVSILDRFGLREYFSGDASTSAYNTAYEGPQLGSMVEEVFYVLITVLSENANASRMPMHLAVRREIIHALAMGPCSFSDLVKRVAERLVDDVCFERMLREVANLRAPEGPTETGTYELKEEAYEEVNPFFYHYTRNRREEVEAVLRSRIKKRNAANGITLADHDIVIPPKPFGVSEGPFKSVTDAFETEALMQVMFYAVWNVLSVTDAAETDKTSGAASTGSAPPSAEAILDQVLHLIMLAIVEKPKGFCAAVATKVWMEVDVRNNGDADGKGKDQDDEDAQMGERRPVTLLRALWKLGEHEKYTKLYKARVRWIFERMETHAQREINELRDEVLREGGTFFGFGGAKKPVVDKDEERKKAAKRRQEAIMQQMKAQQASFASMFGEDDDDDGLDEDGDEKMEEDKDAEVSFGTCIVCQEDLNSSKLFGALGLVQPSRLLRRHPEGQSAYINEVLQSPLSMDRAAPKPVPTTFPPPISEQADPRSSGPNFDGFPSNNTRFGLHASVCSHLMHLECFQVYSASIRQRHRAQATRNHPECIPRKEYICPLCKSLGNVILPVNHPDVKTQLNPVAFSDWIRAASIQILKSKPDPLMESLQFRNGTGEFVFWAAQDPGYSSIVKKADRDKAETDAGKMLDTVMVISRSVSSQSRHLRERPEPETSERGAGLYIPEELIGYTIATMEVAQRGVASADGLSAGVGASGGGSLGGSGSLMVDTLSEAQTRMVRGLLMCLTKLVALHFKNRPDEGRDAVRQSIIKRLLPEWSRSSLTSYAYPLLLRDPFTILIETAAIAPEMLRHVLVLTYYAHLARTAIGLVYTLSKTRSHNTIPIHRRAHEDIFGDLRIFFMSVVRHSPIVEHTATVAFDMFGEARIEKLFYEFTLPFLRRAAILCRSVLPAQFVTPDFGPNPDGVCEYNRLLGLLGIPPLSALPGQDTLQNALAGWCGHYGHFHAATAQFMCGIHLDYPAIYRLAKLPVILDNLFSRQDPNRSLMCLNCETFPNDAAICLICGTTVCLQSHCCLDEDYNNRGECNMHTRECGGTIGIYYCVKRCSILYLNSGNGTFTPSPYLDSHGEVDMSMSRRGRRQYLHHARWEVIRKTWLAHGAPSMVARKLESSMDNGGWETL